MKISAIDITYLSQDDLLKSGCFDMTLALDAAEKGLLSFDNEEVLFPEKIVQIFNEDMQYL